MLPGAGQPRPRVASNTENVKANAGVPDTGPLGGADQDPTATAPPMPEQKQNFKLENF